MKSNGTEKLLTTHEAAAYAHVSEKTIRRAIDAKALRHARLGEGAGIRFRLEWIDEWIDSRAAGPVALARVFPISTPKAPKRAVRRVDPPAYSEQRKH